MTTSTSIRSSALDTLLNQFEEKALNFSLKDIADALDIEKKDLYLFYPSKDALIQDYYLSRFEAYQSMTTEIDGYAGFTLEEKLSTFVYTMFDLFASEREFVGHTFKKFIAEHNVKSEFQKEVEQHFKELIVQDHRVSEIQKFFLFDCSYAFLTKEYFHLIRYWIKDGSKEAERSMALTDKLVALVSEVLYTQVLDKGLDLARYIFRK